MAVKIDRWEPAAARDTFYFYCTHGGVVLQGKASKAVADAWPGTPLDATWTTAANTWAEPIAQERADRLDYEASPTGQKAAAQSEVDALTEDILRATDRQGELKDDFPTIIIPTVTVTPGVGP